MECTNDVCGMRREGGQRRNGRGVKHTTDSNRLSHSHYVEVSFHYMERSRVLPTTQFAYQKGLGTCNDLVCAPHTLKREFKREQKARIVQIDLCAAFDRVNHQGILHKLCFVGVLKVLCCLY